MSCDSNYASSHHWNYNNIYLEECRGEPFKHWTDSVNENEWIPLLDKMIDQFEIPIDGVPGIGRPR